jgi:hypothetical protein
MVLHSGNHEIIGIRHRKTQTLYISDVIEPHRCADPAYGKINVGIYIAAINETIDRERQDIEKRARDPSPSADCDIPSPIEEANSDEDMDGYSRGRSSRPNKRTKGSRSKGKRKGGHGGNTRRHGHYGKEVDQVCIVSLRKTTVVHETSQALLADAAKRNCLCLRFCYDIYDSPHPAIFYRLLDGLDGLEKAPEITPPLHITGHSEQYPGSTGIVHIGTMAMDSDPSSPITKVAIKLAFSRDEKSRVTADRRTQSVLSLALERCSRDSK